MMKNDNLYQHFRAEEHYFVERMMDLAIKVASHYTVETTEFLDPRQVYIARSVLGQHDLQVFASSDDLDLEYAKLIIAPTYYQFDFSDFQMDLVEISYNAKFAQLKHAQIMGALLNQLGIKRQLIGDILLSDGRAQVFIDQSMTDYLIRTTNKIANVGVTLQKVPITAVLKHDVSVKNQLVLVSSRRLDKLLAEVLHLSRSKAISLLVAEKVKLNYALTTKPSELLELGDLVSIRGFGRFKLVDDQGMTKTGKEKLIIATMIHKKK